MKLNRLSINLFSFHIATYFSLDDFMRLRLTNCATRDLIGECAKCLIEKSALTLLDLSGQALNCARIISTEDGVRSKQCTTEVPKDSEKSIQEIKSFRLSQAVEVCNFSLRYFGSPLYLQFSQNNPEFFWRMCFALRYFGSPLYLQFSPQNPESFRSRMFGQYTVGMLTEDRIFISVKDKILSLRENHRLTKEAVEYILGFVMDWICNYPCDAIPCHATNNHISKLLLLLFSAGHQTKDLVQKIYKSIERLNKIQKQWFLCNIGFVLFNHNFRDVASLFEAIEFTDPLIARHVSIFLKEICRNERTINQEDSSYRRLLEEELKKFVENLKLPEGVNLPQGMKDLIVRCGKIPFEDIERLQDKDKDAILLAMCKESHNCLLPLGMISEVHRHCLLAENITPERAAFFLKNSTPEEVLRLCYCCYLQDDGGIFSSQLQPFRRQLTSTILLNKEILEIWRPYLKDPSIFLRRHGFVLDATFKCIFHNLNLPKILDAISRENAGEVQQLHGRFTPFFRPKLPFYLQALERFSESDDPAHILFLGGFFEVRGINFQDIPAVN